MKKYIFFISIIIIFTILLLCIYSLELPIPTYQTQQSGNYAFGCITRENILLQHIYIPHDEIIKQLDLKLATYSRVNTNNNNISIIKNNILLYSKEFNSNILVDNSFFHIPNLNILVKEGEDLTISISSEDATSTNCITAWISNIESKNKLIQYNSSSNTYTEKEGELIVKISNDKLSVPKYLSTRFLKIPVWIFYGLTILLSILLILVILIILYPENRREN